jgi:regulator of sirC expression with transglutaminase-like and TPR domain
MSNEKDFFSLLQLIDDQDEKVYGFVASNIIKHGKEILPHLIFLQETNPNTIVQKRTKSLIDHINTSYISNQLIQWAKTQEKSIWDAVLFVNQIFEPLMDANIIEKKFSSIKRDVWLELNDYLTPLEQINVINKIFYQIEAFQIESINYKFPNGFLISQLLEQKKGNGLIMGIFYKIICTSVEIPIELFFITLDKFVIRFFIK